MWITRRRSPARPPAPVGFEALEVRLLLATTATGLPVDEAADPTGTILPAATGRIDNYDLAAGADTPEVLVQIQFDAATPTRGTLVLKIPNSSEQMAWDFDAQTSLGYSGVISVTKPDGSLWAKQLQIDFSLNPASMANAGSSAGTYDLSIEWVAAFPPPAAQLPTVLIPSDSTEASSVAAGGNSSSSPAGSAGATAGSGGTATNSPVAEVGSTGTSTQPATTVAAISVQGKPLPPLGGSALSPWVFQGVAGIQLMSPSFNSTAPPLVGVAPGAITSIPSPGLTAGPATSGVALGPIGPFPPLPSLSGPVGGEIPSTTPHGEARPTGSGSVGEGSGPSLIVGPLPPGRSDPNGGIFERSFTSTVGHAGLPGADSLIFGAIPSGVGQSGADAPRWFGSLGHSATDDWLTPFGVDQGPSGRATPPAPSPIATAIAAEAQRDQAILLPSVGMSETPPGPATLAPAMGGVPPALAFVQATEPLDPRTEGQTLPPPPSRLSTAEAESDRSRDRHWGWPAVTIMALVGSAVMIFRLHAASSGVSRPE